MKKILPIFYILIFIILCSCNGQGTNLETFSPSLPLALEKLNTSFIIVDPEAYMNSHKNNDIQMLELENRSTDTIIFPGDYHLKIYQKKGSNWVEVANNIAYPQSDWVLPSKNDWKAGLALDIVPYIEELLKPTTIRVFAFGTTEKTGETVGAYIDLPLTP
jgi:hypothetical protein